jgi:imidazolonepropionase-like amidohydrolase
MKRKAVPVICAVAFILALGALCDAESHLLNIALENGQWFNGTSFERRTVYSVQGRFTSRRPPLVNRTLDLSGAWIVPPFAEAHNHNLATGVDDRERQAIRKYLADGVFYVKIQGNLPISEGRKRELGLNRPDGIDVVFAQGSLTGSGGHPITLVESLLAQGYYPGYSEGTLREHRYFTIDSDADLARKWPVIVSKRPDFLKIFLWFSDEHATRHESPDYLGQRGLDPRLLPRIINRGHADNLRVSAHVTNAADFHQAVTAGVDEITHIPLLGLTPITSADARLAAARQIVVITTCAIVPSLRRTVLPESAVQATLDIQRLNLQVLLENRVTLAIGSDNVTDSSIREVEYLKGLGMFDNLTLLRMWTEASARTIFPGRRIGRLAEGYEASFLALGGDPLEDLQNFRKIKIRFKQGFLLK